ncbi:MAG: aminotransferase class I/II-fold pyridoxal phosphate-dependent enzyme [Candidatus Saccharibacteria bacterium]|nr:aminotransferase class I/II-fold pyridoxal phosphate-dependent enzyme [Candidatus Saccharibacteria bacterium]
MLRSRPSLLVRLIDLKKTERRILVSAKLFLGQASNYKAKDVLRHIFAVSSKRWSNILIGRLKERYEAESVYLMSNGRSAIAAALKTLLPDRGGVIINGFTCYAVLQAVKYAGCTPIYADINEKTLNFDVKTLEKALKNHPEAKAIIIQNTLGIRVNIAEIEAFAKRHGLKIVEDLAHSTGLKYLDGREVGSVGDAAALSFGKGKSLDTTTGGALVLKNKTFNFKNKRPKLRETLRARWYPLLGAIGRGFSTAHLGKFWYGPLIRLHLIERAVDAKIDLTRRPAYWQAKLAARQIAQNDKRGAIPIRTHRLVRDRGKLIEKLDKNGYDFREIWYDVPVSPIRYYKSLNFPEKECPVATKVASEIINIPTYYKKEKLEKAFKIIEEFEK